MLSMGCRVRLIDLWEAGDGDVNISRASGECRAWDCSVFCSALVLAAQTKENVVPEATVVSACGFLRNISAQFDGQQWRWNW